MSLPAVLSEQIAPSVLTRSGPSANAEKLKDAKSAVAIKVLISFFIVSLLVYSLAFIYAKDVPKQRRVKLLFLKVFKEAVSVYFFDSGQGFVIIRTYSLPSCPKTTSVTVSGLVKESSLVTPESKRSIHKLIPSFEPR